MCTGATLLYKIKTVVVGENVNFSSFAEKIMREQGVKVVLAQDPHCIQMMKTFIEGNNNLWKEEAVGWWEKSGEKWENF